MIMFSYNIFVYCVCVYVDAFDTIYNSSSSSGEERKNRIKQNDVVAAFIRQKEINKKEVKSIAA